MNFCASISAIEIGLCRTGEAAALEPLAPAPMVDAELFLEVARAVKGGVEGGVGNS